jgi:hypothetical protein
MVINDLDIIGITVLPHKANAPLLVDPDAVLPLPVTVQCLQLTPEVSGGFWLSAGVVDRRFLFYLVLSYSDHNIAYLKDFEAVILKKSCLLFAFCIYSRRSEIRLHSGTKEKEKISVIIYN